MYISHFVINFFSENLKTAAKIVTLKDAALVFFPLFILTPEVDIPSRTNDNSVNTELRKFGIVFTISLSKINTKQTANFS